MPKFLSNRSQRMTALVMSGFVGVLLSALPSYAGFKPPGDLDKPGNRRGLATRLYEPKRGPLNESTPRRRPAGVAPPVPLPSPDAPPLWDLENTAPSSPTSPSQKKPCTADGQPTLTTLVPKSNIGLTATAFPTFYWYTPTNTYRIVQFTLYKVGASGSQRREVYSSTLQVSGKAGLSRLSIPDQETTVALEPGTDYQWQVGLYCSKKQRKGLVANGWIRFVPPSEKIAKKIAKAKPKDKADIFAEAGYWYDAVQSLSLSRREKPQDKRLTKAWRTLFESEAVQLTAIAKQK